MAQITLTEQISQRYAEALKDLALSEEGLLAQFGEGTLAILQILKEVPEVERFLATPLVSSASKKQVLAQSFGGRVHPYLVNFAQLLVDRRRIANLRLICEQFQAILRRLQKTALAEVTSAVPLTDEQRTSLVDRIRRRSGIQNVELRELVKPELLGGMIIKIGDEVIDASLQGQLRKLTLQLTLS